MPIFRRNPRLLRRFRAGDKEALEEVYNAYVDKIANVVRFGYRVPGASTVVGGLAFHADEVADLVQEVFAKSFAAPARHAYDGVRDYGPYLYAVARNAITERLRRRQRELPTPWRKLEQLQDAEIEPIEDDRPWLDEALVRVVRDYVARLDEDFKRVHQVRYVDCLPQRAAAQRLGIGRQTLRTLEVGLRDGLRRELESLSALQGPARRGQ